MSAKPGMGCGKGPRERGEPFPNVLGQVKHALYVSSALEHLTQAYWTQETALSPVPSPILEQILSHIPG